MKKEMIGWVFLVGLFLVSFVVAEQYTSTTTVAFNSGAANSVVTGSGDSSMLNNIFGIISLVLIIVAIVMLSKLKKRKAKVKKAKVVKKKKAVKKAKKKSAKKKLAKKRK